MTLFVNNLIKHDIVQKSSINIDNLFECITAEFCIMKNICKLCI